MLIVKNIRILLLCLLSLMLFGSCVEQKEAKSRYYGDSYNFIVTADSMQLLRYLPSESSLFNDTLYVYEDEVVAVSEILTSDSLQIQNDTVWVQLMHDETTFGWVEEMSMREQVVPSDPISQAIAGFANSHYLFFGVFVCLIAIVYIVRKKYRKSVPMVHVNDISTSYPAVLCLLMATAATLYATIQMFDFEGWQYYYYHPTINPLAEHGIISLFLTLVWVVIIMAVASVSEVTKHLKSFVDASVYLLTLFAVCCINYVLFSQLTLCYIGYPLLIAYWILALCYAHRKSGKN